MATQYTDGHFGETKDFPEAIAEFATALDAGTAKAFHVGTPEQITEVKAKADLQSQFDALANDVECLKATGPMGMISVPTTEEVERFAPCLPK